MESKNILSENIENIASLFPNALVESEDGKKIDFDILALGEDHVGDRFDKVINWCKEHNKQVVRLKRTPNICSSDIKKMKSI